MRDKMLMNFMGVLCWAICIVGLLMAALAMHSLGAELSISGNCSGDGSHIMVVSGVFIGNMTTEEAVYVLGPGHNLNITRAGLITFKNGTQWQVRA
jgi:hypothetical protein